MGLMFILINSAIKTLVMLVLNLFVTATAVITFIFIGYFLVSIFRSSENNARS
ncbi:hypothetical protein [Alkalibacillus haloalkaliphilus]|uniref:hypothetical protein n=1 Tax=Alkalibacillus haloalkaliphilus TaxID=94136 RepID=UPI002935ED24|nr:hypothetical protein [Alkalibacillus haloalkaliphilus]MDV2582205.1 hypothetical protein [Alkalibacillus haloalkaliphilus]